MIPIETLLADHQLFHSEFQMDSLITVRSGGTIYGCYKQSLREVWKRWRGLRDLYTKRELHAVECDRLAHGAENGHDQFQRRIDRINLASNKLAGDELRKAIEDTQREFLRFYGQAVSLREALGIPADGQLSDERRAVLDAEFWEHQLRGMIAVDLMTAGRMSHKTIQFFVAMPVEMRQRVATECLAPENRQTLIDWYTRYTPAIPEPKALSPEVSQRLLSC